jgi:hypothetical protein
LLHRIAIAIATVNLREKGSRRVLKKILGWWFWPNLNAIVTNEYGST